MVLHRDSAVTYLNIPDWMRFSGVLAIWGTKCKTQMELELLPPNSGPSLTKSMHELGSENILCQAILLWILVWDFSAGHQLNQENLCLHTVMNRT